MRAMALVAAALVLAGCVSETTTGGVERSGSEPTTQASPSEEPDESGETAAETSPQPTESTEPTEPSAVPCEDIMFQRAQGTIRSQQNAFANEDFAAARAFASQSFQDSVSVEQFQSIIQGTYEFLLGAPSIAFNDCQRDGDSALIQVEVDGSPSILMVYRVVLENESWFIDAASIAGTKEEVTA